VGNATEQKEAIEEIYLILAEFFKYPTEEFFKDVSNGTIDSLLKELVVQAGYQTPNIQLTVSFNSLAEMQQSYMKCFMGVVKPYAPPIESVYKVWTSDPTAELSIARSKGYIFGDSALHINHLFEEYHLEVPEEYAKIPDHLTILLEFLAFMIKEGTNEHTHQLLVDHFDWLDDFKESLLKVEDSHFYVRVTDFIRKMLEQESLRVKPQSEIS